MTKILQLLHFEEGFRPTPYYCSLGYPTWGGGLKLGCKGQSLDDFAGMTITREESDEIVARKVQDISTQLLHNFSFYYGLNQARKDVLISMCFQMGISGVSKFCKTIEYISKGMHVHAGVEMLDSKWAKDDTPNRAKRHAIAFISGSYSAVDEYKSFN